MYEWVCRFGLPIKVYSDGGTHFNAMIVESLMNRYGISLEIGPSHHSHRQGKVERFVGSWLMWLPAALYVIRTTSVGSSRLSPYFLLYGRHPRNQEGMVVYELEEAALVEDPKEEEQIIDEVMLIYNVYIVQAQY
ncbi:hypothetical protein G6F31_014707 [Rhizopus arrhizus]|nr:hypothetical protein G6F31_014707 [Rhizopus arrhizus]